MKVLAIVNHKGGTSKTTVAKLFTEHLSMTGRRVLGIDVDAQCNFSARFLKMELTNLNGYVPPVHEDYDQNNPEDADWGGRCSVATLYREGWTLPYRAPEWPGVEVIPGDGEALSNIENLVRGSETAATYMRPMLKEWLTEAFRDDDGAAPEYVVIDTPPQKGPLIDSVFTAATHILIPSQMEEASIEGLYTMMSYCAHQNLTRGQNKLKVVGILATQVDNRRRDHREYLKYLSEHESTGKYVLPSVMTKRAAYNYSMTSASDIRSVLDKNAGNEARQEALAICEEIVRRMNND